MSKISKKKLFIKGISLLVAIILIVLVNIFFVNNDGIRNLVQQFGYFGIFLVSAISGFNLVVPIPIIGFYPFFIDLGFNPALTIFIISLGMSIGDLFGYTIGRFGKQALDTSKLKTVKWFEKMQKKHALLPSIILFLYAAFAPVPNEIIVIPLALMGMKLGRFTIAILLGNILFNILAAFGVSYLLSVF